MIEGFVLSHILRPVLHIGATIQQLDTPAGARKRALHSPGEINEN